MLTDVQLDQICVWAYEKNNSNEEFGYREVKNYIEETWMIPVTKRTAGNYLAQLGLTMKTCQVKTGGQKRSRADLETMYYDWVLHMRANKAWTIHPSLIRSIDVVYGRRPTGKTTTFSPSGESKQVSNTKPDTCTNAYVSMISADGVNHTPCMMYTHDKNMSMDQLDTVRGRAIVAKLVATMAEFGIDPQRVVHWESGRRWCSESPEMYEHFLNAQAKSELPDDALIMHDGGGAFKRAKASIFPDLGLPNHVTYPAAVHQWLSPNDNNLHGVKAAWAEEYRELGDSVRRSLRLMQLIDLDTVQNSKKYFLRNLIKVKECEVTGCMST